MKYHSITSQDAFGAPGGTNILAALGQLLEEGKYRVPVAVTLVGQGFDALAMDFKLLRGLCQEQSLWAVSTACTFLATLNALLVLSNQVNRMVVHLKPVPSSAACRTFSTFSSDLSMRARLALSFCALQFLHFQPEQSYRARALIIRRGAAPSASISSDGNIIWVDKLDKPSLNSDYSHDHLLFLDLRMTSEIRPVVRSCQ